MSNEKVVFYETLLDENASCHFALGDAYEICGRDSETMNSSGVHVDFMVGCADLCIMGVTENGETIKVMENG